MQRRHVPTINAFQNATTVGQWYMNKVQQDSKKRDIMMEALATASMLENDSIYASTSNQVNLSKQLKQVMEQQDKILASIANNKMGMSTV